MCVCVLLVLFLMGCNVGGGGGAARFGLSRVAMLAPLLHATMSCSKAQSESAKGGGDEERVWQVSTYTSWRPT